MVRRNYVTVTLRIAILRHWKALRTGQVTDGGTRRRGLPFSADMARRGDTDDGRRRPVNSRMQMCVIYTNTDHVGSSCDGITKCRRAVPVTGRPPSTRVHEYRTDKDVTVSAYQMQQPATPENGDGPSWRLLLRVTGIFVYFCGVDARWDMMTGTSVTAD